MENYKLLYLQQAKDDLTETVKYIVKELKNPIAAENLAGKIISAAEKLKIFPYSNSVYNPLKPLKHEYRRAYVENYSVFYYINEQGKTVTVSRIIYSKRNLQKQIKK